MRLYTNAIAYVNPSVNETKQIYLDNEEYENLYGVKYSGKSIITIEEGSGMILLKRNKEIKKKIEF